MVNEELAAMRRDGLKPLLGKAKACAARRLEVSRRTLERLLALDGDAVESRDERFTWDELKQIERGDWEADQADSVRD